MERYPRLGKGLIVILFSLRKEALKIKVSWETTMTLQNVCRETFCSLKTFRNLFSLQIEALKHFNVSNLSPFVGFDYERSRDIFEFFDLFLVLFIILATEKY